MSIIFKHPNLQDYFKSVGGITQNTPLESIPSLVNPYENGKVLHFPNLKLGVDHDFWAGLPTDVYPGLKKLSASAVLTDMRRDPQLDRRLQEAELPSRIAADLVREISKVYDSIIPIYERIFSGYSFVRRRAVWRLNTIRNENLHVDTYKSEFVDHFARLFINLDNQPRIWMTSWSLSELYDLFGTQIPTELILQGRPGEIHESINRVAFGGRSNIWWDDQPRHVAYFEPGDVWVVDSRQVSHQIFYGRRAVSIDFFVDRETMGKQKRHYLAFAHRFRARTARERLQAAGKYRTS